MRRPIWPHLVIGRARGDRPYRLRHRPGGYDGALRSRGVEFTERRAGNQGLYQLFMVDPNGIKIELNFDADEA
jgi:hypothetical protein